MEKLLVTKEQASALEYAKLYYGNNFDYIIKARVKEQSTEAFQEINKMSIKELAIALLDGYEIALSPEEQIKNLYKGLVAGRNYMTADVVLDVLRILDKNIEGLTKPNTSSSEIGDGPFV